MNSEFADTPGGIVLRVATLERELRDERAIRRNEIDKLDREKADNRDIEALKLAFTELRKEVRDENEATRTTLKWFIGIYVVGLLGFAGIAIQVVSNA